ncbi:alpha/beta hydrolase [Longimicrobium sp.]|uniref:alpha/beta hydrolase n=1 Tax=Longimicrobium sp. TaxID=2029185 RepID=UPI002D1B202F|nr:alpha/beta fold hydrolase [Longimicrobium sp.]HSU14616.1 alpha/beta fold hydrolase [Longimicrobium sp.]
MLKYETVIPPHVTDGAPLVVLMHGRGADRFDLMGLAPALAPDAVVVCPEAPWPGMPWGYGPGWAWYRFLGRNVPDPESFDGSQAQLAEFLAEIPAALPVRTGPLVLGGFSQGGVMSMAYALRNPGAVPLVMNFSGFLAQHPSVRVTPEAVAGTRFFWGHGTMDPQIPFDLAIEGRALLRGAGADLTERDYRIGHGISPDEARDARAWLAEAVAAPGG